MSPPCARISVARAAVEDRVISAYLKKIPTAILPGLMLKPSRHVLKPAGALVFFPEPGRILLTVAYPGRVLGDNEEADLPA